MTDREPPADVIEALEMLERADSPKELGRPYQVLLDWRRQRPVSVFTVNAIFPIGALILLGASQLFLSFVDVPVTDFWRGVNVGILIAMAIVTVQNMIWPRPPPPQSINARIESAIDRWRHAVPAMRELPR
ncbi:MAG: hypothetical protein DCF16_10380 [Alphaproteobacteria bacterium]|nr:MAG: hypothetical protein DCF16_10380 [Alphaproteobacteria bacterium]